MENSDIWITGRITSAIKITVYALLYVFLILSLTPVIAWIGGFGAAIIFGLLYWNRKIKVFPAGDIGNLALHRWTRLSVYAMLFGIVFFFSCKIYSQIKIHALETEAIERQQESL